MKKIIILLMLAIPFIGKSQNLSAGIKAGVNFTSLNDPPGVKTKVGPQFGVFAVYSIVTHFGVSGDLIYSAEGAKYEMVESGVASDGSVKLNYLRIPLLANVFFNQPGDAIRPKISLGPNLGFLLSSKTEINVRGASTSTDTKSDYNGFDLGAIVGAGLNIRAGDRKWLNVDLRYNIGASDVRKNKPAGEDPIKNQGWSISAGLAFGIGEE